MTNHFYQCSYCLTIMVAPGERLDYPGYAECGICEQNVNYLGYSGQNNKLLKDEEKCPCDGRCTGARGPNCDCQCNGANHGLGSLVTVTRTSTNMPKLVPGANSYEAGKQRAIEYKEARTKVKNAYKPLQEKKNNGTFIPRDKFIALISLGRELAKIHNQTNHKNRLKALDNLVKLVQDN